MQPNIERLASGFRFAEGPVWHGPRDVTFVDLAGQSVYRWRSGAVETVAATGGAPNGCTIGADGALYVANNGGICPLSMEELWQANDGVTGRIQRVTLDGAVTDVAAVLPGPTPWRPNDLRWGPDGSLYFTDPHNWEELWGVPPNPAAYGVGSLCRVLPDGSTEVLERFGDFPNGLAWDPDWSRLFVAQTNNRKIQVMDFKNGKLGAPRVFCETPKGGPDGIAFDASGRLYVCGSLDNDGGDALFVFDRDGKLELTLDLPEGSDPTNIALGDGGIYLTLGQAGALIHIEHDAEPAPILP